MSSLADGGEAVRVSHRATEHSLSWRVPGVAIVLGMTALAAVVGGAHLFNVAVASMLALALLL